MRVNQRGEQIFEEPVFPTYSNLTDKERDEAIALLCEHLNVEIWRTNATKHGDVQLVLRPCDPN